MSGPMSRLRRQRPMQPNRDGGLSGPVQGVSALGGLPFGTELGRAEVGPRCIGFQVGSRASMWCIDAETDESIGALTWGDGMTPHIRCTPSDRFNHALYGLEAEHAVRCGMALWRHVFNGHRLEPSLRLIINHNLPSRSARRG